MAALASVAGVLVPVEIALWAFTGGGYFWPVWGIVLLGGAALVARVLSTPAPANG